jgi:hypothetical protein
VAVFIDEPAEDGVAVDGGDFGFSWDWRRLWRTELLPAMGSWQL